MQAKIVLAVLASSMLSVVSGAAVHVRDIFDPTIISPNSATTWVVGVVETVTWHVSQLISTVPKGLMISFRDTSNAPVNISNLAKVVLHSAEGPLTNGDTLATGFDLRTGNISVTVPSDVTPGSYYITCKDL
ncbi:hypothetical protein H0H92_000118 [Tricholoma furcatifolium]|nr:hypothetical protein H0H92_000118 [Tricholoma furcatifolium]